MLKNYPYWWESAGPPQNSGEHKLPPGSDVLIIGAGLTGLSAARTLAISGKSVLVLDSGSPGIGASSRNGGMIGGGHRIAPGVLEERYGREVAAGLLHEMHIDSMEFAKTLMAEEKIECDFVETGRCQAFWRDGEYDMMARNVDRLRQLIPVQAEMVPKPQLQAEVATRLYGGGVVYANHGGLNPAKWVAGICRSATAAGARIIGDTPVHAIDGSSTALNIETARGTVRAGTVLVATNGYTTADLGPIKRRIFPLPSFIIVTEELGENRVRCLIPNGRMIVETRERYCYYRPSPDRKRIVFGGRAGMFEVPERFAASQLKSLMTGIFPELRGVRITHSWRGKTGFTFELSPHVGREGSIWHAMGYCGNGNSMAPWLGHKAALMILGDPEGETAFSKVGMPTRWWYRGTPWFLPFADGMFRVRDAWSNLKKAN